jgi:putative FmdB family regulatory protein
MPIYEYICKNCGERTEVIQRVGEKPLTSCPHCGKRALKKAVSAPAIQFKGSGWYVTDYARAKKESSGKADKSDRSEKSEKSSEKASDGEKAGKSERVEKSDKSDKKKEPKS